MPRPKNCANCGRAIEKGNEVLLGGKYYGSECASRQVDIMNAVSLQEDFFEETTSNEDLTNE